MKLVFQRVGSMSELARRLKISRQAISKWRRSGIPRMHVLKLERLTGIPRSSLRPDVHWK